LKNPSTIEDPLSKLYSEADNGLYLAIAEANNWNPMEVVAACQFVEVTTDA
jgi:hypothetical protein